MVEYDTMKRLLLILALLQAPTPTPVPLTYQNDPARPIAIWKDDGKGGTWTNVKPLPTPKAAATPKPILEFKDDSGYVVVYKGDEPQGPCNLGDLVRAAQAHLDREDPENFGIKAVNAIGIVGPCETGRASECRVARAEGELEQAKEHAEAIQKLRAELARCSPAKGGGK